MPRHLCALTALTLPLTAVAIVAPASGARADDGCATWMPRFSVTQVHMDTRAVSVSGLEAKPVRFTMTTQAENIPSWPGESQKLWNRMELGESQAWDGPTVHLKMVSESGMNATWQGVLYATGPSRTLTFDTAAGDISICELGRQNASTGLPPLRITATNTPVVRTAKMAPVALTNPAYRLSGQVLSTAGRPYGRRLTVKVGRGDECDTSGAGTAIRTDAAGRFSATLRNAPTASRSGAPVDQKHCVRLPGSTRDALGHLTDLAFTQVDVPWTYRLPVVAPRVAKRGATVTVRSRAPLPVWREVRLERLWGRTAWRQVGWGPVRESGRIDVDTVPDTLGRQTYRLRTADSRAISAPFVMSTTR